MRHIRPDLYRLGSGYHNFYVFVEGGKATVVDAGCSKEWPDLVDCLASIGLTPQDVEAIIVTHAHADHIGFGREAADHHVRVEVHEEEEPRALGTYEGKAAVAPTELPLWRLQTWRFSIALIRAGVMKQPRLRSVETFSDGEILDLPGRPRVVHTPGHTEGHCAFLFSDRGVLCSGDALVTQNLLKRRERGPQLLPSMFHNDPDLTRESLTILERLEADLILPGHGTPFPGTPAEAVAIARSG